MFCAGFIVPLLPKNWNGIDVMFQMTNSGVSYFESLGKKSGYKMYLPESTFAAKDGGGTSKRKHTAMAAN
jgi:hypothetical protein